MENIMSLFTFQDIANIVLYGMILTIFVGSWLALCIELSNKNPLIVFFTSIPLWLLLGVLALFTLRYVRMLGLVQ